MADHSGPASAARPVPAVPPRQLAVPWVAVAALAAAAWAVTAMLARDMGNGPGTMGLALAPFLGLWVVMMAAMMLPSVAPVAVLWTRLISGASSGFGRVARLGLFLSGYLLTWAAVGAAAFAALAGTGQLLTVSPGRAGGRRSFVRRSRWRAAFSGPDLRLNSGPGHYRVRGGLPGMMRSFRSAATGKGG